MFSFRNFILDGLCRAVGQLPDYQVILNAVGWHTKAVLTEEDLNLLAERISEKDRKNGLLPEEPMPDASLENGVDVQAATNAVEEGSAITDASDNAEAGDGGVC